MPEIAKQIIALIDQIVKEHKTTFKNMKILEQVANDAEAMAGLEQSQTSFMPGRLDQKQGLQKMQKLIESISQGLYDHFNREETRLLVAFEKHGDRRLVTALNSLLMEHEDLRGRLEHSQNHLNELTGGKLGRHTWEASAHDLRSHISHTYRLLEAHAGAELELLSELKRQLIKESK